MKAYTPILAAAVAVLIGINFAPIPTSVHPLVGGLALALALALTFFLFQSDKSDSLSRKDSLSEPAKPPALDVSGSAEAEVIAFLGMLQEKGRLIDFLMDDISKHDDAAIGAVARVVYQGCREVLDEHLKVSALAAKSEGSTIEVPAGYQASEYKLSGKLTGKAPFTGTLVHKGWKVESIKLPKVVGEAGQLPPLAPAQVEIS